MCSVIMQNGEIIGVDAMDNTEIAKFNIDKIAGVVRNDIKILER